MQNQRQNGRPDAAVRMAGLFLVLFCVAAVLIPAKTRMNTPGTLGENWRWRLVPGQFTDERADYLSWLVDTFGRF